MQCLLSVYKLFTIKGLGHFLLRRAADNRLKEPLVSYEPWPEHRCVRRCTSRRQKHNPRPRMLASKAKGDNRWLEFSGVTGEQGQSGDVRGLV